MKILYGVVGEGMGHAMRSRVVLERLTAQGHEIHVMASSRAADFLAARFSGVRRIHGFLAAIPGCEERLAGYVQDGNERLYEELDRYLLDSRRSEISTLERGT
jgi:trehalose-6-phosphatase